MYVCREKYETVTRLVSGRSFFAGSLFISLKVLVEY